MSGIGGSYSKQVLKEFNIDVARSRLVVGVDMGHKRVSRAVYSFTDDTAVLFLSLRVFVSDVPLQ